jgi:hypothetical protein
LKLSDLLTQESISGSPVFLSEELRLDGVSHLLEILCDAYGDLCDIGIVTPIMNESEITEEFFRCVQMIWYDRGPKTLTFHNEKSHGRRIEGRGKTPTIDLCFRDWDPNHYFGIECKILEDKKSRYDYYVNGGVCRYIRGDYGKTFPSGAMIGYILTGEPSEVISKVVNRVDNERHCSNMKISNPINGFTEHYESIHKRKIGVSPFNIHHLFFNFT